jgi:hypothetical protein
LAKWLKPNSDESVWSVNESHPVVAWRIVDGRAEPIVPGDQRVGEYAIKYPNGLIRHDDHTNLGTPSLHSDVKTVSSWICERRKYAKKHGDKASAELLAECVEELDGRFKEGRVVNM